MKLVILSGAGLSAPSGLPTYEQLRKNANFKRFFSVNEDEAIKIVADFFVDFGDCKPNKAHSECVKLEKYCKALGIDFFHYTLNIDNLIETSGGFAHHLYGCVDEHRSIVENRFFPSVDLGDIPWEENDILIVLGVSNNGYPLAYLESNIISCGGAFYNYNLFKNDDLSSEQFIGNLVDTLTISKIVSLIPLEFTIFDLGAFEAEVLNCTVNDREYIIYFSPSLEYYTCPDEIESIENYIGNPLTDRTYEIKFDLKQNEDSGNSFTSPSDNFTLTELNLLGLIIATAMGSHARLKEVTTYTASAVHEKLIPFYNRLAKRYSNELEFQCKCAFGPKGVLYVFKK